MKNCDNCVRFVCGGDEYSCGKCGATGRPALPNDICGNFIPESTSKEKEEKTNEAD